MAKSQRIEISPKTILIAILFLLGFYFVFLIRDVLFGLLISFLLMTALNPAVNKLQKSGVPRSISIWVIYLVLLSFVALLVAAFIPVVSSQTQSLIRNLNMLELKDYFDSFHFDLLSLSALQGHLESIPRLLSLITSTFSVFIAFFTILIMTFYLLLERYELYKHLTWLFGDNDAEKQAEAYVNKVEIQLGSWVRGQVLLMFIIGITTYIALVLLGIPFALPLAIFAGLLELIPSIGPIIAAVPAVIIAFTTVSPLMALVVAGVYILIQQIENSYFVPKVMQSAVGLNPLVTIVLLLVGFRLGNVAGTILVVPVFLLIKISLTELYRLRNKLEI